jgi:hypothetical protein
MSLAQLGSIEAGWRNNLRQAHRRRMSGARVGLADVSRVTGKKPIKANV